MRPLTRIERLESVLGASCAPYFNGTSSGTGIVFVNVNQATSGSSAGGTGFGSAPFACDGQNHKLAVQVQPGPWQLGQALASATACGFSCDTTIKQIRITQA